MKEKKKSKCDAITIGKEVYIACLNGGFKLSEMKSYEVLKSNINRMCVYFDDGDALFDLDCPAADFMRKVFFYTSLTHCKERDFFDENEIESKVDDKCILGCLGYVLVGCIAALITAFLVK